MNNENNVLVFFYGRTSILKSICEQKLYSLVSESIRPPERVRNKMDMFFFKKKWPQNKGNRPWSGSKTEASLYC